MHEANIHLALNAVPQAKSYRLEIAQDEKFNNIFDSLEVVTSDYKLEKSLLPGTYFWQIASLNVDDKGPYGKENTLVISLCQVHQI